eukprot:1077387-Amphidinium_carterae.1
MAPGGIGLASLLLLREFVLEVGGEGLVAIVYGVIQTVLQYVGNAANAVAQGCFQHVTFAVLDPKMAHVFADTFNTRLLGDQNATDKPSKGNQRSRR